LKAAGHFSNPRQPFQGCSTDIVSLYQKDDLRERHFLMVDSPRHGTPCN
jgi:hypothetical protein